MAMDHIMFYKVIRSYPCFSKSAVVGPDIVAAVPQAEGMKIIQA